MDGIGTLHDAILVDRPNITWSDVIGLHDAKERLKEYVILPLRYPQLFKEENQSRGGILIYGPPGTGKTMLAKATATEVESTLFNVQTTSLIWRYAGEGELIIKNLFDVARQNKPSIVLIDDIEGMFGSKDGEPESTRRLITELIMQIDGPVNNTGITVIGITNVPWTLSANLRRRFSRKIYTPMPETSVRTEMFNQFIKNTLHGIKDEEFKELGKRTEGFSGSDISGVARDALIQPVRKVRSATHFKQVKSTSSKEIDLLIPCLPEAEGAIEMRWEDIEEHRLLNPCLCLEDVLISLSKSKSSVAESDIKKYEEFSEEFVGN